MFHCISSDIVLHETLQRIGLFWNWNLTSLAHVLKCGRFLFENTDIEHRRFWWGQSTEQRVFLSTCNKKTSEVLILSKRGKNDAYSGYEMLDPHAATAGGKNITGTSVSRFLPQHYVSQMQVNIQYKSHGSYGIDSTIVNFSKFTRTTFFCIWKPW